MPWDQALDIILQAKGLGLRKSGNVILIAPKDELNAKEKIELEAKQQIAALEPLRTQAFQLNYAKADDITKGLTGQAQSGSSAQPGPATHSHVAWKRGIGIPDQSAFVTDIPSKLKRSRR